MVTMRPQPASTMSGTAAWMQAKVPAQRFVAVGMDHATPAPGVLDAIRQADVVLLPPSNPVVSIGIILGVPGVRDALRGSRAPVVGVSPLIGGMPVRGHADACLAAIGVGMAALGVGNIWGSFLANALRNPAAADGQQGRLFIGFAVTELLGLLAFVVAMILLFVA